MGNAVKIANSIIFLLKIIGVVLFWWIIIPYHIGKKIYKSGDMEHDSDESKSRYIILWTIFIILTTLSILSFRYFSCIFGGIIGFLAVESLIILISFFYLTTPPDDYMYI